MSPEDKINIRYISLQILFLSSELFIKIFFDLDIVVGNGLDVFIVVVVFVGCFDVFGDVSRVGFPVVVVVGDRGFVSVLRSLRFVILVPITGRCCVLRVFFPFGGAFCFRCVCARAVFFILELLSLFRTTELGKRYSEFVKEDCRTR